jgi:hypothetical protein
VIGATFFLQSAGVRASNVTDDFAAIVSIVIPSRIVSLSSEFVAHQHSTVLRVAVVACLRVCSILLTNSLPDYLSLLETWFVLHIMRRSPKNVAIVLLLIGDLIFTAGTAAIWNFLIFALLSSRPLDLDVRDLVLASFENVSTFFAALLATKGLRTWLVYPAFFTSIWLWLYGGSGFLLKAARRFDIGFDWFNRKFDIEKKPLQSIGLVSGVVVAVVYWTAVIVGRLVG